ncbi:MAG: MFS transporter [bacterium]|nr:MFS transporter [bacterium]
MLRRYLDDFARMRPAARRYLQGSALMGAAQAVSWTLLVRWLDAIGYTKTQIGSIQSADSWGKTLIAIPAAFLLARRSARGVFVGSAVVAGCAYLVMPSLSSFRALYVCNFIAGLAMTVHYVAIAPFLFRHSGPEERAGLFGLAEAVRTMAAVVGAFAGGHIVGYLQETLGGEDVASGWVIRSAGFLSLFATIAYWRIEDHEPSMPAGRAILPVVREHRGLLARFAIPQFVIATGAGFCIPFLPLYFKDRFDFAPGDWGSLFSAGQVLMSLGFLMTPFALARLGFVRSIVAIEMSSIPFFLVLAFTGNVGWAVLAFLMRGALMNSTHPLLKNMMMQSTPAGAREVQTGINATLWGVGWVVGPIAAGRVLDATGDDYAVLMQTTAGLYVVAAVLSWLLLRPVEQTRVGGSARVRVAEEE